MIIAGGSCIAFHAFLMFVLVGEFYLWAEKRLFVVNFHNFLAQRSCEWSFAKELIVKNFPPYKTRVPYCRRFQDDQHAFTLLKSIACMLDEAFQHKFRLQNEWEISFCTNSLLSNCRFFSSSLSFFQSLFLSRCFCTDTCRWAHTSREPTSEKCNLSISAAQREDKQCWRNEGINTLLSWCWTNMSRCLQFTNGPAMFSTHRCGNPRTNWMAPVADVVSGFVCSPSSSPYCLADLVLEGRVLLKWQQRDGCS